MKHFDRGLKELFMKSRYLMNAKYICMKIVVNRVRGANVLLLIERGFYV